MTQHWHVQPAERGRRSRGSSAWSLAAGGLGGALVLGGLALGACGTEDVELTKGLSGPPEPAPEQGLVDERAEAAPPVEPARGCQRVDFLFIVDNSGSMKEEQENLARSFPGFIDVVEHSLRAQDYHIMVIDTDASGGAAGLRDLGLNDGDLRCVPAPACCRVGCALDAIPFVDSVIDSCYGKACAEVLREPRSDCEGVLGAGKRLRPDGESCGLLEPHRYMIDGQPELSATFACAAQVGTFGDGDEQPMAALMNASSPSLNGSGGCNAGFWRDDAVAVITLITDEDDRNSPGDAEAWRRALLDAKGGNQDAVVLLGLLGDGNVAGGLPGGPCAEQAKPAPVLQAFVQSFRFGSLGSVCASDYAPFFRAAVSVINGACEEFHPLIR
jgi:hypothetical protein